METNETRKREQYQAAEQELIKLIEGVERIEEGNLKDLEDKILEGVLKIGKRIMESRMGKVEEPIEMRKEGKCGHKQKVVGYRPKKLLTLFGEIEYKRAYYQCQMKKGEKRQEEKCSQGRAPSDEKWGVNGTRTTPGVQRLISYYCSMLTYEEAAEAFSRVLPLGMSAKQALNLMKPVGKALADEEDKRVNELFDEAMKKHTDDKGQEECEEEKIIERLYIEPDGIMERMRRGSVEMKEEENKRDGDVYREIKVGAVFEAEKGRERSELAPDVFLDTPKEGTLRYVARRTARGGFGRLLYTLAHQGGLKRAKQVVILGDGAIWIWKLADEHFPAAVQIVDLYHAKEHVWEVAHAVFGRSSQQGSIWGEQACTLLCEGKIEDLLTAIGKLPTIAPPPGQAHSVPEQALGYFTTNAERMRYPHFRAQGMHVGSGIVESACKTVVSTRFKRSGMRWTPDGLDAALPLRAAKLSGTYDAFWEHRQCLVA